MIFQVVRLNVTFHHVEQSDDETDTDDEGYVHMIIIMCDIFIIHDFMCCG